MPAETIGLTKAEDLNVVEAQNDKVIWSTGVDGNEIWMGDVNVKPSVASQPQHHAESETVHYILNGSVSISYGEDYSENVELKEGDFIYIPPYRSYILNNESAEKTVRIITFMASEFSLNYVKESDVVKVPSEFKNDSIKVKRAEELDEGTKQTKNMPRLTGIQSSRIWIGRVTGDPGKDSGAHHHGEAETGGFIIDGVTRLLHGDNYEEYVELEKGDFLRVPPFVPHIERNMSQTETVEFLTARNPANIVVNLD